MADVISFGAARAQPRRNDAGLFARLAKALTDYRLYRATVEELRSLTDRDLADLGLHRSMIDRVARESVYGA